MSAFWIIEGKKRDLQIGKTIIKNRATYFNITSFGGYVKIVDGLYYGSLDEKEWNPINIKNIIYRYDMDKIYIMIYCILWYIMFLMTIINNH